MSARKPKPPTARSVSATLRNADFRAGGDEGYRVSWAGSSAVRVEYVDYISWAVMDAVKAAGIQGEALTAMTRVLRRKGWMVTQQLGYLLVTAMEGKR